MKARIALGILGLAAFVYQITASWDLAQESLFGKGIQQAPFELAAGERTVRQISAAARAAGLETGDEVLAINGEFLDGANDLHRAVSAGKAIDVRWRHAGQERTAFVELETIPRTWALVVIVTGILTPLICLATGFGVALIRPHDRNAWILLLLMLSFSQLASIRDNPVGVTWPLPLAALAAAWPPLWSSLWGLAMALFGLFFPTRLAFERKHHWFKWLLVIPFVVFSVSLFLQTVSDAERFGLLPGLARFIRRNIWMMFWLHSIGVGIFFTAFGFRRGTEKNADAIRRLNLIWWGSIVSLIPTFATVVAGLILRRNPLTDFPPWIMVPVLLLLFVFPATLAYVIVVHRAMNVRVVVRQGLQYALAQRGVVALRAILILVALWQVSLLVLDPATSRPQRLQAVTIAVSMVALSGILLQKLRTWIDRKFFREVVNAEKVLNDLGDSVRSIVETQPLLERVARVVAGTLHVDQVVMLLDAGGQFTPAYAVGVDAPFDGFMAVAETVRSKREPVRIADGEKLALPLAVKDRLLGMMLLGPKKSEEPYSGADIRLLQSVAGQTGLAIENSQLTATVAREVAQRELLSREFEIAREVQQKLFPQTRPQIAGMEYAGKCRPAQSVGGDYFDFIELPAGGLGIAVGDVSGKGIPAALLMASLQACLRGQTMDGAADLAKLMSNVNRLIFDASPVNRYATFFYGQYNPETKMLTYVNAGHNPPIVLRGPDVLRLEEGGPVIGLFRPAKYQQGEIALQRGDIFIGFTDGISEAMNAVDEEWGEDLLIATARRCGDLSADAIIDQLIQGADKFAAGAPQNDDMTLIVAKLG